MSYIENMSILANTYKGKSKYARAEVILRDLLEVVQCLPPDDNGGVPAGIPEMCLTHDLAQVLFFQLKIDDALHLLKKVVNLAEASLGSNHVETLRFKNSLLEVQKIKNSKR